MRIFLTGLLVSLLCQKALPQNSTEIANIIKSDKIFTNEQELKDWIKICNNDTIKLFDSLKRSSLDSIPADSLSSSIFLLKRISVYHSSLGVKNAAISLFLTTSKSKNSSVSSISIRALGDFPSNCFDKASVDSISSLIVRYPMLYRDAVLLAGYVGNPTFIERINSVFPNSRSFSKQDRWATYKALARLGDKDALSFCVNRVALLPLSDQVIDVLYPDLVYIHKKEALELMVKALFSEENLCTSTNPNSDNRILCGYRIMELLAPVIVDFPIKVLPSGDLDVKDYKQALVDVRAWFNKNKDTYIIR